MPSTMTAPEPAPASEQAPERKPRRTRRPKPPQDERVAKLGAFPPPTAISEQLAVENRLLAMDFANRFARSTGMNVADLETPAWVGLLKACRLYDPEKVNPHTGEPYSLSSLAVPYIKGAMKQYVRDRSFAIKFPHRWREIGPKVRRLAQFGKKPEEIQAELQADGRRIDLSEVLEIIACQKGTVELDTAADISHDDACLEEDEEDAKGWEKLAGAMEVMEQAFRELCEGDRDEIEAYWKNARLTQYPNRAMYQFRVRVREIVGVANAPGGMQLQPLGFIAPEDGPKRPSRRTSRGNRATKRSPVELTTDAEQDGLFIMPIEPEEEDGEP